MSEAVVDDIVAVLPPLLQTLESLGFIARHLNPPDFGRVMDAAGTSDEALQAVRPRLQRRSKTAFGAASSSSIAPRDAGSRLALRLLDTKHAANTSLACAPRGRFAGRRCLRCRLGDPAR